MIRTTAEPLSVAPAVRRVVAELDPDGTAVIDQLYSMPQWVGAFWLTQLVQTITFLNHSVLYGVGPRDAAVFAAGAALLLGAVLLACDGPTRRATRIDPVTALRHE